MTIHTAAILVETRGRGDMLDITDQVEDAVAESGLTSGTVTVFVPGSTASISTVEFEPGLQRDIPEALDKIAPYGPDYHHHDTWSDDNGASHVRATLMGPSLVVPFVEKTLALGTWQQIVLLCFDTRPRRREIVCQVMGE